MAFCVGAFSNSEFLIGTNVKIYEICCISKNIRTKSIIGLWAIKWMDIACITIEKKPEGNENELKMCEKSSPQAYQESV